MAKTLEQAVHEFEQAAGEHGAATEEGDSARANKNFRKLARALNTIRKHDEQGRDALIGLLEHEDPNVRLWAASYLFGAAPEKAVETLEAIAQGRGICAFDAKITLQEWRENPSRFLHD